jgi:hypothetical protein
MHHRVRRGVRVGPGVLRRIGEYTVWAGLHAGAASVLLTGVLVVYLVSEALSARAVGVCMFVAALLVGVAAYRPRLRRRPWLARDDRCAR